MIDERAVDHPRAIAALLRSRGVGDLVPLRFRRDDRPHSATLVLESLPQETCPDAQVTYASIVVEATRLRTITVRPTRPGRHPAVLLLPGLACVSQDLAVTPDVGTRALVAALASAGIVTMRVERPGLGDSEGGPCEALSWSQELEIYRTGLAVLAGDAAVDPDNLGLFGSGVGGMLAPLVGADERARRIAVHATSARRWSACLRRAVGPTDRSDHTDDASLRSELYTSELDALDLPRIWRAQAADVLVLQGPQDPRIDPADAPALADLLARRDVGTTFYRPHAVTDGDPGALAPAELTALAEFFRGPA